MAKNIPALDDSLVPPPNDAKGNMEEASSSSEQTDSHFEDDSPPAAMPPEGNEMVDVSNQPKQEQDKGSSALQNKMPDPSLESLNVNDTSSLLAQGEEASHLECHAEIPDAFLELPSHTGTLAQLSQGEEDSCEKDPVVPAEALEPLELGQEAKGNPLADDGGPSDISSEQQKSGSNSSQLDIREESGTEGSHGQPPGSPGQAELAGSPKPVACNGENSPTSHAAVALQDSPGESLLGTDSPKQPQEDDHLVFPSHPPSSVASNELFLAAKINEDIKPGCQETAGSSEEERTSSEQGHLSLASKEKQGNLNREIPREGSADKFQAKEEQFTQDTPCAPAASSLALADVDQQRAAITAPQVPAALPTPSPVATSHTDGPAHQGLAAACDEQGREGLAIRESSTADRDKSKLQGEAGTQAELESEREGLEATRDAKAEETARHLEGAKHLTAAKDPEKELPGRERPTGARDSAGAMVLAGAEDPLGAMARADPRDLASSAYPEAASEHAGSHPNPGEGLLLDLKEPASTEDLASAAEPASAMPVAREPSLASSSGWPSNQVANVPSHPETPIEREIRLHLEREELLRQERGLTRSRGTQEYVEVRIKPILNQSMVSSTLPKEKERQRAGAQMQREIQRECRREEDLVQLGKVRGAYDRGMPQELQQKKLLFEQHSSPECPASRRMVCGSNSADEETRGPSFAEANLAANVVILNSGPLPRPRHPPPERTSSASPFFSLRAKSPQSLLEQEVQEAQEREQELQRQRYNLYGSALPCYPAGDSDQEEEMPTQPERPSCKKLDITWPPPSPSETSQVNGLHQLERSPRMFRRQRSALIQRWESGAVGNQENQD
ncbi:uncharacterized protein MISP3 [Varanus komodoensis]|uniref:uncharacterized protein MISP3 n=1 Tax=Varanus komodoensis TaxID=61221 RepID=UPI001CF7E5E2|nr:uncharacterized protein MISP3 [Varanus komodoensis]